MVVCGFVALAVANNWSAVRDDLAAIPLSAVVLSGAAGAVALLLGAAAWMTVLDSLGHRMPAHDGLTVFFAGQLGKYAPGSVWPAVIQAQLGQRNGVPRTQMVASYIVAVTLSLAAGGVVGLFALAGGLDGTVVAIAIGALLGGAALVALVLHERGLQRWARRLAERFGKSLPPIEVSTRAALLAGGLSVLSWLAFGVHAWLIARPLGADASDLLVVTGAFALAFVVGVVVLPLPAGAGVREAVLILVLGATLGRPGAIALALVSRFVLIVVELLLAAATGVPGAIRWSKAGRDGETTVDA